MDSTHSNLASESSRLENLCLDDLDKTCLDESKSFNGDDKDTNNGDEEEREKSNDDISRGDRSDSEYSSDKDVGKKGRAANKDYVFECTFQSVVEAMTEIGKGSVSGQLWTRGQNNKPKIN